MPFLHLFIIHPPSVNTLKYQSGGATARTRVVVFIDTCSSVIGVVASIPGKFVAKLKGAAVAMIYHNPPLYCTVFVSPEIAI